MVLLINRPSWYLPDSAASPEALVLTRRRAAGLAMAAAGLTIGGAARADVARNAAFDPGRAISRETDATQFNNYYEFSESKNLWKSAQALKQRPWSVKIDGLVANPRIVTLDDLLKQVALEERVYRHRCVERWAMTVPWTGFPLADLVKLAEPKTEAKFVVFETAQDPAMPGLDSPIYPWPYIEALTMPEAVSELPLVVTGLYGNPVPPQNGGPLRLVVPWKYGFKSAKAIVKISFTAKRPTTFWEAINPNEYGFWANVNPAVSHPRWSQKTEELLGSGDIVPSVIYNGYAAQAAPLYAGLASERLFM